MDRVQKLNQAYIQKPWRTQLQWVGLFLSVLVFLGLIAGVNLKVNAEAATIGRQIQLARVQIDALENEIIDQQALLAELTSATVMKQRAQDLGFKQATSDEIVYLVIEGYEGRTPVALAIEGKSFVPTTTSQLPPEFTQTLLDVLLENISLARSMFGK